ncbi:hypothetical protein [Micromonospora sp. NPDC002717]
MPAKLTRDEAIHLVDRIMRLDYADDAELNDWLTSSNATWAIRTSRI